MDFVWSLRNKVVREDYKLSMEELGRGVMRKFREHWMIMNQDSSCSSSPSSEDTHWVRPDNGVIKLNFDAAIVLNDSAVAVVARNWRGRLVFAVSSRVDTNIPVQAEAEAIRLAAITALKHNIPLAIFESDSKVCVQSLNSSILVVPWRIANVVTESKAIACLLIVQNLFGLLESQIWLPILWLGGLFLIECLDILCIALLLRLFWMLSSRKLALFPCLSFVI